MTAKEREQYFKIIDGVTDLIPVVYEIHKYVARNTVCQELIGAGLCGQSLKNFLKHRGVVDFDNAQHIRAVVNKLCTEVVKNFNAKLAKG